MPRSCPPSLDDRRSSTIESVADCLLAALVDGPGAGPTLVRLRETRLGPSLAFSPLPPGASPTDALLGHVVPSLWPIAGLMADGLARRVDRGADEPEPVALVVLVDRAGRIVHRCTPAPESDLAPLVEPPSGRLVDLLRRSVGCPTSPPEHPPRRWWAAVWLDAIVTVIAHDPVRPRSLDDLIRLHPLAHRLASVGADDQGRGDWEHLRAVAAAGAAAHGPTDAVVAAALAPFVDRATAAWMDAGCFARWVEGALPDREDLLVTAEALLPPSLAGPLRRAVGVDRAEGG